MVTSSLQKNFNRSILPLDEHPSKLHPKYISTILSTIRYLYTPLTTSIDWNRKLCTILVGFFLGFRENTSFKLCSMLFVLYLCIFFVSLLFILVNATTNNNLLKSCNICKSPLQGVLFKSVNWSTGHRTQTECT